MNTFAKLALYKGVTRNGSLSVRDKNLEWKDKTRNETLHSLLECTEGNCSTFFHSEV